MVPGAQAERPRMSVGSGMPGRNIAGFREPRTAGPRAPPSSSTVPDAGPAFRRRRRRVFLPTKAELGRCPSAGNRPCPTGGSWRQMPSGAAAEFRRRGSPTGIPPASPGARRLPEPEAPPLNGRSGRPSSSGPRRRPRVPSRRPARLPAVLPGPRFADPGEVGVRFPAGERRSDLRPVGIADRHGNSLPDLHLLPKPAQGLRPQFRPGRLIGRRIVLPPAASRQGGTASRHGTRTARCGPWRAWGRSRVPRRRAGPRPREGIGDRPS